MRREDFTIAIKNLQDEAIRNRPILAELAGMEKYVSETYVSRVFYEIIQNADDCNSTKFHAFYENKNLLLFNNGHLFSKDDFSSLCRSAQSNKIRGQQIGYRGIGFKSVAGVSNQVSLISGDLEVFFCKEATKKLFDSPSEVPLLRVPHEGYLSEDLIFKAKSYMKENDLNTCFILHDIQEEKILNDMKGMNLECLIFLRSLKEVFIKFSGESFKVTSENQSSINFLNNEIRYFDKKIKESVRFLDSNSKKFNSQDLKSLSHKEEQNIRIWRYLDIEIATNIVDKKIIRLSKNEAYTHAFLPMLTPTGFGARINGDFSTDPSRTRLSPDDNTKDKISSLIDLIIVLLKKLDTEKITEQEKNLLEILIPYKRSENFSISPSYISNKIKEKIFNDGTIDMHNFFLKPSWCTIDDYKIMASNHDKKLLIFDQVSEVDYFDFFNKLGAKETNLETILKILSKVQISDIGIHLLIENIIKNNSAWNVFYSEALDSKLHTNAKIFLCNDGKLRSGNELSELRGKYSIDYMYLNHIFNTVSNSFKSLLFCEKCGLPPELIPLNFLTPFINIIRSTERFFFKELMKINGIEKKFVNNQLSNNVIKKNLDNLKYLTDKSPEKNIFKIKTAKKQISTTNNSSRFNNLEKILGSKILNLTEASGYGGYNFKAKDKYGKDIFIVLKSISNVGEDIPFKNLELNQARKLGFSYWLIILLKSNYGLTTHYSIIPNFYKALNENIKSKPVDYKLCCTNYENKVPFEQVIDNSGTRLIRNY